MVTQKEAKICGEKLRNAFPMATKMDCLQEKQLRNTLCAFCVSSLPPSSKEGIVSLESIITSFLSLYMLPHSSVWLGSIVIFLAQLADAQSAALGSVQTTVPWRAGHAAGMSSRAVTRDSNDPDSILSHS